MRALILIAGAALTLSGCGGDQTAGNTSNVDQDLASEDLVTNDATAIDAALGVDADMAADVTINVPLNIGANDSAAEIRRSERRRDEEDRPEENEADEIEAPTENLERN